MNIYISLAEFSHVHQCEHVAEIPCISLYTCWPNFTYISIFILVQFYLYILIYIWPKIQPLYNYKLGPL